MIPLKRIWSSISIEPLLLIYFTATGLQGPTIQALWYRKVCMILHHDEWICDNINTNENLTSLENEVQAVNSQWDFYANLCGTIPSMLVTFIYGSWSDRISRKLPIMLPIIGNILADIIYIFNAKYITSSGGFMLVCSIIHGISGGTTTMFMATVSYVADVTNSDSRTFKLSITYGVMYVGQFISAMLSGVLYESTGFTFMFTLAIILHCIGMIYLIFGIQDVKHRPKTNQETDNTKADNLKTETAAVNRNPFNLMHLKEAVSVPFKKRRYNDRAHILVVMLIFSLHSIGAGPLWTITYLYLKHPPLSFDQTLYGFYRGYGELLSCTCMFIAIPILKKRFQVRDSILYTLALVSNQIEAILMGFSVTTWMIFLAKTTGYLHSGLYTFGRTMLSMMVDVTEIGKLFATLAFLQNFMSIISSALYNGFLYPLTIDTFAGFSYILGAIVLIIPISLSVWLHLDLKKTAYRKAITDINDFCMGDENVTFDGGMNLHQPFDIMVELPEGNEKY